jgi:hypothetical protein
MPIQTCCGIDGKRVQRQQRICYSSIFAAVPVGGVYGGNVGSLTRQLVDRHLSKSYADNYHRGDP